MLPLFPSAHAWFAAAARRPRWSLEQLWIQEPRELPHRRSSQGCSPAPKGSSLAADCCPWQRCVSLAASRRPLQRGVRLAAAASCDAAAPVCVSEPRLAASRSCLSEWLQLRRRRPGCDSVSRALLEDASAPESLPYAPVPARTWSSFVALAAASPLFCPGLSQASYCGCTLHTPSPPSPPRLTQRRPPSCNCLSPSPAFVHCLPACPSSRALALRSRPSTPAPSPSPSQLPAPAIPAPRETDVKELRSTPHHPPPNVPPSRLLQ